MQQQHRTNGTENNIGTLNIVPLVTLKLRQAYTSDEQHIFVRTEMEIYGI